MNKSNYGSLQNKVLVLNSHFGKLGVQFLLEDQDYAYSAFANDFALKVIMQNQTFSFNVNVKKQLVGNTAINLIENINYSQNNHNILLVSDYISPQIEKRLVDKKISFINASGKVFLHQDLFLFYIDYPEQSKRSIVLGAAFEATGVKFIFHLLYKPEIINRNYQELADLTGVSTGSVTKIFKDLKKNGFLYTLNNKRILRNKDELLDQWFVAYGRKLRPKILIGRYRRIEHSENLQLPCGCYWSSEVAVEKLNLNLRSKVQTVYTNLKSLQAVKKLRLVPDENGSLELLSTFWNEDVITGQLDNVVPKSLIYADLMLSGNDRNIEIAHDLFK